CNEENARRRRANREPPGAGHHSRQGHLVERFGRIRSAIHPGGRRDRAASLIVRYSATAAGDNGPGREATQTPNTVRAPPSRICTVSDSSRKRAPPIMLTAGIM